MILGSNQVGHTGAPNTSEHIPSSSHSGLSRQFQHSAMQQCLGSVRAAESLRVARSPRVDSCRLVARSVLFVASIPTLLGRTIMTCSPFALMWFPKLSSLTVQQMSNYGGNEVSRPQLNGVPRCNTMAYRIDDVALPISIGAGDIGEAPSAVVLAAPIDRLGGGDFGHGVRAGRGNEGSAGHS
jgi:hypothetical protein